MTRDVSLKNVKISTIKPYPKTEHPAIVEPSVFDLTFLDVYIPLVFFYKPEKGQHADAFVNLVERLKESLSKALVPYYPLAGRWVKTYDARIRELKCDDEGVTFIEASINENLESVVNLYDFEAIELLAGHQFMGLDPKAFHQDVEIFPSLFIQVTRFKCGSMALHVTFCHMTTDSKALYQFMEVWSEIALHGRTSTVPIHDRSLTTSLAQFMKSIAGDVSGDAENVSTKKVEENPNEVKRADPGVALRMPAETISRNKTLHVRRKVIEDLKREAAKQNIEVTTLDLITACLWRCLNKTPDSMDGKTSSVMATGVEGRSRFHDPSLPVLYSGNALLCACTPNTPPIAQSVLAAGDSPIFAASIIHKTVQDINTSNWKICVARLAEQLSIFPNLTYRLLSVTSWIRFPMYEITFGHGFGKPVLAGVNYFLGFLPYGLTIVHPPPPALSDIAIASIQLAITSEDAAKTLLADEEFRSFFLPFN